MSGLAKRGNRLARGGVQGVKIMPGHKKDALIVAVAPVSHSAIARLVQRLFFGRAETPDQFAGGGVEGKDPKLGRCGVEDAVHDDGIALHLGILKCVAGVVFPGYLQAVHVAAVDLLEGGVMNVVRSATGNPPGAVGFWRRGLALRCALAQKHRGQKNN